MREALISMLDREANIESRILVIERYYDELLN